MQLGLNKHLQPREIKSYKHKTYQFKTMCKDHMGCITELSPFNGHFPGEPGLADYIEAKDNRGGV